MKVILGIPRGFLLSVTSTLTSPVMNLVTSDAADLASSWLVFDSMIPKAVTLHK